jgi:hypothetical protein
MVSRMVRSGFSADAGRLSLSGGLNHPEIGELTELWSDTANGSKDAIRDKLASPPG